MNERNQPQRSDRLVAVSMVTGVMLIGISTTDLLPKKLVWNASTSMPTGLYSVQKRSPMRGELVIAKLPDWARMIADQRAYLPSNVPALKRVSALAEDRVCRFDREILVNGTAVARALWADNFAVGLPVWGGCVTLEKGQVFLLADHPRSFDGRYFGVTKMADIFGVAKPLWVGSD